MAAAACALALVFASQAFTVGSVQNVVSETSSMRPLLNEPTMASQPKVARSAGASSSTLPSAGFVALMIAAGVQAFRSKSSSKSQRPRLVVCQASAATAMVIPQAAVPVIETVAPEPIPQSAAREMTPLISYGAPATVDAPAAAFVATTVPEFFATASARSHSRRGAARRAGSSRCKSARRASQHATMTEKAARRQTGAKLQAAPVLVESLPVSFDSSRSRTKIQLGLRFKSRTRCANGRETKTPSSSLGATKNTRVYLQVSGFASIDTDTYHQTY